MKIKGKVSRSFTIPATGQSVAHVAPDDPGVLRDIDGSNRAGPNGCDIKVVLPDSNLPDPGTVVTVDWENGAGSIQAVRAAPEVKRG